MPTNKFVPSIDEINPAFTVDNWKLYLKSTDKKLKADAQRVQALIGAGQLDAATGKPTATSYGSPTGGPSVEQGNKYAAEEKARKERAAKIKAWNDYDEQKALNDEAVAKQSPLPFPKLKPPAFPRVVAQATTRTGTANKESERYQAQVPAGATGTGSSVTESTDETFNRLNGTAITPTTSTITKSTKTGKTVKTTDTKVTDTTTKPLTDVERKQALLEAANKYYIPESFFADDPELQKIFNDFVFIQNGKKDTEETFFKKLKNSTFLIRYNQTARERLTKADQYERLLKQAGGNLEAVKNTALAYEINQIVDGLKQEAQGMGATVSDQELNAIALDLYKSGQNGSFYARKAALRKFIKAGVNPLTGGTTLTGQAAADQQTIFTTMANNGFNQNDLSAVFGSLLPTALAKFPGSDANTALTNYILQDVANGASLDDYTRRIRDVAGMGYNDAIRNLLAQGTDLKAIATPYMGAMAQALELNPETITLNDPTIRAALMQDKTMNLYDFTKQLRKDDRWQYTKQARDDVYGSALQVLRDFGFTG